MRATIRRSPFTILATSGLVALLGSIGLGVAVRAQTPAPAPAAQSQAAPAGDAAKGKELYTEYYCYSCHGTDGQGGAGVRIAPNPVAFNTFRNYVRKPTGGMPPYVSKTVPEQDLINIYAFLKTIQPGPTSKAIPMLND